MKFCCHFMTMPGLIHRSPQSSDQSSGSIADCCQGGSIPHLQRDGIDYRQLSRYWNELSSTARRDLLRIDKQSLFEQVRKHSYCSRCNGLLLEAFSQLANYSKSHQGGSLSHVKLVHGCNNAPFDRRRCISRIYSEDDIRDPSVHPWGGLTATRDGTLTLVDSFLNDQPLEVIQHVSDCARAREREHELLYPDACGGGGRGWITQGIGSFGSGKGHSLKETCALHTARLSCDALVDFWSALGEEARTSLLKMKEEDFIARLLFRFEKKRFCRDCRRNVLKELKELKELKRSRKEPKCTRWFCNADTAFQYEVSNTSVNVKWKEWFGGGFESTYQYFEWALGSAEGNADILGFEDVGCSEGARVEGLDLSQISQFYIILRGWKHDGRCTEVSVKAYGLKDKQCVHQRILVGDGHVTITKGDSIKQLFEHAEEVEEEENDDEMDNSGSELENEVRRQKHAKSPELAREFLLDAATVIFKEQVEKAFREGTARQNAHTIFVSLALNLLEERIYVAYKEISTLEKQKQLLEEEEHERRENQRRRERKRLKEREKKSRRKEKQRGMEHDKEKSKCELQPVHTTATDCDSGVTSPLDEIEEVRTKGEIKECKSILNGGMCNDWAPDALQPSTLEPMEILDCRNFRREALDQFDLSMPMDNFEEPSIADRKRSFFLERTKTDQRRSRRCKGPFMEVISRRFIRQSSITSLNTRNGLQGCMKLSCSSLRETSEVVSEQVFVSSQKFCGGFGKSLRNMKSNHVDGWNNRRLQQRQNSFLLQSSSKRTSYIKSMQDAGTGSVGKEYLSLKSSRRKNSVVLGNKKVTRTGSFVSGSSQCSWQVIKTVPAGHEKRELQDEDNPVDFEIISSNSSSKCEKMIDPDHKEGISADAGSLVNTNQHDACNHVSPGCFVRENQHNMKAVSADRGHAESLAFATLDSPANEDALKPLGRVMAVSIGESLNDDASLSSATSCLTDSGDGGTSCCSRTESPNFWSGCSSIEVSTAKLPTCVPAEHEAHIREPMQLGIDNKTLWKDCDNAHYHDTHQPASAVERYTHLEHYSYSSAGNSLTYSNNHTKGYEHMQISVNPEVPLLAGKPHMCHTDSTLLLPLLPASLMPMHTPQSLGLPWVPSQCMAQPVMNAGLLPLSHSPGNLYMDGFGQSMGGMQALLLPVQPPFQPLSHIMGLPLIPTALMHQSFTPWSEQHWMEPLPFRNAFEEKGPVIGSLIDKHSSAFSNSPDVALPTNLPSNDPLEFSLFHFGSLSTDEELTVLSQCEQGKREAFKSLDLSCSRALQEESAALPKSSLPVEEYSLFAETPSSRFGFF